MQSISFIFSTLFDFLIKLQKKITSINLLVNRAAHCYFTVVYLYQLRLFSIIVNRSGNIEPNSGPKPISCKIFSIKLPSVEAFISVKVDIIRLSERYLNSLLDDENLIVEGYTPRQGQIVHLIVNTMVLVFIVKAHFHWKYLHEWMYEIWDLMKGRKLPNFMSLYQSLSQLQDRFVALSDNP